jgi:hypothetical protein
MKRLLFTSLLCFTVSATSVNAQTETTTADPAMEESQQPAATTEEVKESAGVANAYQHVRQKSQDYVAKKRQRFAAKNKIVLMHAGSAQVGIPSQSKGWADARVIAYKEALQQAREAMIRQLYMDVSTETARRVFKTNQGPEVPEDGFKNSNVFSALLDKWVALKGATYDEELRELGIDPEQYNSAPPSVRKRMMEKSIMDETRQRARGDISGSIIVKSFEASDDNGNSAVSVVIAASNKMKNTLAGLRGSQGDIRPVAEKAGEPIMDYLINNRENLMFTIGTKLVWDEKGFPVLLSFGMSGNDCDPTDMTSCIDNQEFSFIEAEADAYGSLAQTYNLQGKTETLTRSGITSAKDRTISKETDGVQTVDENINELIKETELTSTMTSSVKGLVGLQKAYEWTAPHPVTGHEVNGVVIMWHPEKEAAVRSFKNGKIDVKKRGKTAQRQYVPQSGEGLDSDDEDF